MRADIKIKLLCTVPIYSVLKFALCISSLIHLKIFYNINFENSKNSLKDGGRRVFQSTSKENFPSYICSFNILFQKGTSADQDSRFSDKNKKLMKTMKFADNLDQKVIAKIEFVI